jgi:O-antigen ligase
LPAPVPPGGSIELTAVGRGPLLPGKYLLRWDLIEEEVSWFSECGNEMPAKSVVVQDQPGGDALLETNAADARPFAPRAPPPAPRPNLWRAAVVLWRTRPLIGIGPDNFRRRYEDVIGPATNGQPYTDTRIHANSFYFETLADLGLAGVAALAWMAIALVRALREASASGSLACLGCGLAAGAFFVHGVVDYFLEFTPLFGLFWLLLGLTAASARAGSHAAR